MLEKLAKIVTYALPVVYVCGFVVVSLYEAEFGIADFALLRIKALAAGLLFVLFVGFPSVLGMRTFQLFGFSFSRRVKIDVRPDQETYFDIIRICDLYASSVFSALLLQLFFVHSPRNWIVDPATYQEPGHFSSLPLGVGLASFALLALFIINGPQIAKHFAVKPRRCTALACLSALVWVTWTLRMSDWLFFQLSAWCYLVSLCSWVVGRLIHKGAGLKARIWEIDVLFGFALSVTWFAASMYGNIKPAFGGGSPIAAKLYLQQDNPVLGSKIVDSYIIEETEQGYYVAKPSESDKRTIFIPRSIVTSVQLGSSSK